MKLLGCALRKASCCMALAVLLPTTGYAHVGLNEPTGGESFVVGSTFQIEWASIIEHDVINWDLWYSTTSSSGPWNEIAVDLPLGNPAAGVPHFYDWLIPDEPDSSVWVRVRQDNGSTDYYDESGSFSIVAAADFDSSGQVDEGDLQIWDADFGNSTNVSHGDGDANLDGRVDAKDFLIWQHQAVGAAPVSVQAVPEPATLLLFSLGCMAVAHRGLR